MMEGRGGRAGTVRSAPREEVPWPPLTVLLHICEPRAADLPGTSNATSAKHHEHYVVNIIGQEASPQMSICAWRTMPAANSSRV